MGFNLDSSPAQEARNKFAEITQKPYGQASKPAQATQLTPSQKQAYGIEKPTLPQAKQAPPVQPSQKQFGGVSISAAPKPQWYDTPKRFISASWESFWNPSEQTGETLRTGNPEQVAGALFGVVGSVYGSSKTAASKAGTTIGSKALQFLSVLKPGKTALKVGAGLIASDIALYPFAQQSEQGKQLYGTYTNLQLAGAELYFTAKVGKAAYSNIASAPAVQNIAKGLSASKAGKKALDIFTYTKTINVGKQAFAIAPFATAANVGLGIGTYNAAYGAYNIFAQPESKVDKKEIKRLQR
jgi:hypothetical protein